MIPMQCPHGEPACKVCERSDVQRELNRLRWLEWNVAQLVKEWRADRRDITAHIDRVGSLVGTPLMATQERGKER